ncbi:ArsR family transcriptional regulator [Bacillus sp. V3-13]|uniref:ArsR/SmtB family transcription factor n=1 Tax=Bacillus sp. V3-13 TaxID=2053728 RepID=UPI000C759059|nr:ArsR family transcriptional regulator [Bacillus sp. V3-13]PLR78442.1 ArsR family transcriptional regulator [Bacillus sp. V3-13]
MNLIDMSFKPVRFEVECKYSILFECALGIAASTYPRLHGHLERPKIYWDTLHQSLSKELQEELLFCQKNNTWKILLQLLHERDFQSLDELLQYIEELPDEQLKYVSFPYLDLSQQQNRKLGAKGDERAVKEMIAACQGHAFFPGLIEFVFRENPAALRKHLITLMEKWNHEVTGKDEGTLDILKRDAEAKSRMMGKLSSSQMVQRAAGVEYEAETNITKVVLIPHYIYRPWTIEANLEGTKVFYYPVSDESLSDGFYKHLPPAALVNFYKALGDEKRLRILKLLYEKERTLKELTELLELGKTTVHHHLVLLRSAQIVKVNNNGSYSLNEFPLNMREQLLKEYLQC